MQLSTRALKRVHRTAKLHFRIFFAIANVIDTMSYDHISKMVVFDVGCCKILESLITAHKRITVDMIKTSGPHSMPVILGTMTKHRVLGLRRVSCVDRMQIKFSAS
jgi:hypothetical protein